MGSKKANETYAQSEGQAARERAQVKRQAKRNAAPKGKRGPKRNVYRNTTKMYGIPTAEWVALPEEMREAIETRHRVSVPAVTRSPAEQQADFSAVCLQFAKDLPKTWPELNQSQRDWITERILPLYPVQGGSSNALPGLFAILRGEHLKYLASYAGGCVGDCCKGELGVGYTYEYDGEKHYIPPFNFEGVCKECRARAWADVSVTVAQVLLRADRTDAYDWA